MNQQTTLAGILAGSALAVSCGVFGLSADEQDRLATYQQNAANYYGGERFDQALDMVRRGLEIDPDDYKLQGLAAWCYLRTSGSNPQNLRRAELMFDSVYEMRTLDDHQPFALLGYGVCHEELGMRHARQARALLAEAKGRDLSDAERAAREARAKENDGKARYHWSKADRGFEALIRREEQLRLAYQHMMEIRIDQGDYPGAVSYAEKCLGRIEVEADRQRGIISSTMSASDELQAQGELQGLTRVEGVVRTALAEMHYRRGKYDLAIAELTILLEMDSQRSNDYYNRGRAYEAMGRIEEATGDFKKFLATTKLQVGDDRVSHAFEYSQD